MVVLKQVSFSQMRFNCKTKKERKSGENREGPWQETVRKKYKVKGGMSKLRHKPTNFPLWNGLLKV
jgi:hypothetical protein